MSHAKARNPISLRQGQIIGEPAAEDDDEFLFQTFYEHHAYRAATEMGGPKFLLLGRTGTGKTAILRLIERNYDRVLRISPEELSLQYISNSDIIQYFQSRGVKLDLFYQLLWRHVIATELIKLHFKLDDSRRTATFFNDVAGWINTKRRRAMDYMKSFGSDFWLETDARVTQVTQKFESELKAGAGVDIDPIRAELSGSTSFTEEHRKDIVHRAQKVVDNIHLQQLSDVIEWLADDVFKDSKRPVHIIIDDLDVGFASGDIKLWLIRALIETCKKFRRIGNVKITMALRTDLLERVFEHTRDEGFQEEKYKGNTIEIEWQSGELKEIVDRRIRESITRQYTSAKIGFDDLFPDRVNQSESFAYLVQRTLHRPRDIIALINECIAKSVGSDRVTATAIRKAEELYSPGRFNALRDEWRGQYPLLQKYCEPFMKTNRRFSVGEVQTSEIENMVLDLAVSPFAGVDVLGQMAVAMENFTRLEQFKVYWLDALYKVGVIGLKTDASSTVKWNYRGRQSLNAGDIHNDSTIYIHPMLWRRFGTITKEAAIDGDHQSS